MGLAPKGVRNGDKICQFQVCDITAIVRHINEKQLLCNWKGQSAAVCKGREEKIPVNGDLVAGALMAKMWNEKLVGLSAGSCESFKFSALEGRVIRERDMLSDETGDDKIFQLSMTDMDLQWLTR